MQDPEVDQSVPSCANKNTANRIPFLTFKLAFEGSGIPWIVTHSNTQEFSIALNEPTTNISAAVPSHNPSVLDEPCVSFALHWSIHIVPLKKLCYKSCDLGAYLGSYAQNSNGKCEFHKFLITLHTSLISSIIFFPKRNVN